MKEFFLFAGPNGSGKSTLMGPLLQQNDLTFLNADYCARTDPEISKMPEGLDKSLRAQKETERKLMEMILSGSSFAWETVFSHESRLEIMAHAKRAEYIIHLIYVATKNPDINVARVHSRFLQGGHDVPEEKIRGRYERSVYFLPEMILIADEVSVYDNSYDNRGPELVFQKSMSNNSSDESGMIIWQSDDDEQFEWVMKHITIPLKKMGYTLQCYK